ncbi:hypothetical protein [Micromonospora sp. KC213]|uniref:hypothetical protein n=1 Tax=Micromonospora sp. KC213 TaxID=2530378 RepID=UPI0010508B2D|nr:hypothetical protein [Micromonospora sp. KC213]TDC42998.1 hypothetical protein E1166_05475 [Micromonospora sp. KC213]
MVSLLRLLLLVLLSLGVCGMHTFGHGGHAASTHETTAAEGVLHGALAAPVQDDSRDFHLIAQVDESTTGGSTNLDLFTVCLAILSAFGLTVGLALLRGQSHRDRSVARTRLAVHRGGRSPPVPLLGLRVAAVSVLQI